MALRSLIIDFNSYFASVEQQDRPELRGRPVAVVPVMTDSTCCIAASYEAKHFGVKTGTRVGDARKLCPGLVLIDARPGLYVEYHHKLIEAVDSVLPVTQVLSIDEMLCALRGPWRDPARALATAREIKIRIARAVGPFLRSSIGIAPNPFLAKTASDMEKPNGLVLLDEHELPERLFPLKLRDFCGVGASMEARLHRCGILTVEQLCRAPKETLHRAWNGIEGDRMYAMLRGEELDRPATQRCTVGHSHVLDPKTRTRPLAEAVLHGLLQKAAARLRGMGYLAAGLSVDIKFVNGEHWSEEMGFLETQDTLDFIRVFALLWQRYPPGAPVPLRVGVTLFHLTAADNVTQRLPDLERSRLALDRAMDRLNQCYGKNTVFFGGAQEALDSSPSRIAFTNIPAREKQRSPVGRVALEVGKNEQKKHRPDNRHHETGGMERGAGRGFGEEPGDEAADD
jgi:DNA polymerase-4